MSEEIKKINVEDEMKTSYLSYAMSVIVSRALPDVRDGLKPVHRRILYTMYDMKMFHNKPFKKSARIVGDVMGKLHPHGDAAIYNSLARMAQDFSLRYTLVEGQGNFGSIDGDSAAAMRYTEARMSRIALEMLQDIEKDTVDFVPNYDNSLTEPSVLPAVLPNLLINGSEGIAVAMSTKIPPHNISEVLNALIAMIDNPEIMVDEIMTHIKAPDFPTGGYIYGIEGIKEAYRTGSGRCDIRAKATIETDNKGRETIIITEIPYQVIKSELVISMAELVKDKKIEEIDDIRDESGRDGMRIVVKIKKGGAGQVILNQLYKMTRLQIPYHILFLALHHNLPKLMNIKEILSAFIEHRRDVITRKTIFELRKAQERMEVLLGYEIAIADIDNVIEIIRKATSRQDAKEHLVAKYSLTERQVEAVLELRLHRLTSMEVDKIKSEIKDISTQIERHRLILSNNTELMSVIKAEFVELLKTYGDKRKSEIIPAEGEISMEDLLIDEEMVVTISNENYIKRVPASVYRKQRRGGKGKTAMVTKDEDFVKQIFTVLTHDDIMFFTNFGKVYKLKVYDIPEASRIARGRAIVNLIQLEEGEIVETVLTAREYPEDKYIIMATNKGLVKKTAMSEFENVRITGKIAITINEGDKLNSCDISDGSKQVFIVTKNGKSIRFHEEQVRPMGRTAAGVKGIEIVRDDEVVNMMVIDLDTEIFVVSEQGYGKKTDLTEYKSQNRGGKGVITLNVTPKTGRLVSALQLQGNANLMLITNSGKLIKIGVENVNSIGRVTQGVKLIQLEDNETVVSVAKVADSGYDKDEEVEVNPKTGELPMNDIEPENDNN